MARARLLPEVRLIASNATRWRSLLWAHRWSVLGVVLLMTGVEVANDYVDFEQPVYAMAAAGLLVTTLSIALVFRVNEAYARWWEARALWGEIVNESRSWARQVLSWGITDGEAEPGPERRQLVLRQIAYVNALRLRLRGQQDLAALSDFLPSSELEELATHPNPPARLLMRQAREIAQLRSEGLLDAAGQHRLDTTLSALTSSQGGCERIKHTAFPDRVRFFTRYSAWLMAGIVPLLALDRENTLASLDHVFVPILMLAFLLTERLGAELKNPFENLPNDTPMTALCRTIEIDLRAALGETELPAPLLPEKGVLM